MNMYGCNECAIINYQAGKKKWGVGDKNSPQTHKNSPSRDPQIPQKLGKPKITPKGEVKPGGDKPVESN